MALETKLIESFAIHDPQYKWDTVSGTYSFGYDASIGTGRYIELDSGASIEHSLRDMVARTVIVEFDLYVPNAEEHSTADIVSLWRWDASNHHTVIRITDSGGAVDEFDLTVYSGGSTLATVQDLAEATWHRVALRVYIDDTAGELDLKVNGSTESAQTGIDTAEGSPHAAKLVRFYGNGASGVRFANIVIRADSANTAAGFLEHDSCAPKHPDANGTTRDWSRSAGSDDYSLVDETDPPSTADYLSETSSGDIVTLSFDDDTYVPLAVGVTFYAGTSGTYSRNGIQVVHDSSGSTELHQFQVGDSLGYHVALDEDPATGSAWAGSGYNDAEFGFKLEEV